MVAAAYMVTQSLTETGHTHGKGADMCIVHAFDSAQAISLAQAQYPGDIWTNATATVIAAATDLTGWRFVMTVSDPVTPFTILSVAHVGIAGNDFDAVAAALVILLNATTPIGNAAYATPALTVAGAGDGIGDWDVVFNVYPPTTEGYGNIPVSGFFDTLVDGGAGGAAITLNMLNVLPNWFGVGKQK